MDKEQPSNKPAGTPAKPADQAKGVKPVQGKPAPVKSPPIKVKPMFRQIDWIAAAITFIVIWAVYLFTLAPELTLEDSGELCTGSYYAGIPHPPGYPFWAIYSWIWTVIVPFGNVAWRVEVGECFGAAMGCAMVSLMVSRGSSMLIEGIETLKDVTNQWEKAICGVAGFVTGMLVGLDGYVWSEAVVINRISLFAVPWLILVMLLLMRWIYAPHQIRYLYLAMFCYGICATIHQTLLLSAVGIEVTIAMANPRLGRAFFTWNTALYILGLLLINAKSIPALNNMSSIEVGMFHLVGVGSLIASIWMIIVTKEVVPWLLTVFLLGCVWFVGVSFYFYEPLAGMTCPPMQWGYPRTVEGFFHALGRGQYESTHNVNIFANPGRLFDQMHYLWLGLGRSFGWIVTFFGLLPFLFITKMQRRERGWLIGLTTVYIWVSVFLVILLDVTLDRSSFDLNQVFFTASHAIFGLSAGYGFAIVAAYMATHYQKFRFWGFVGAGFAVFLACFSLWQDTGRLYNGMGGSIGLLELPHDLIHAFAKFQYGSPVFANLILLALPIILILALLVYKSRGPVAILLGVLLLLPVYSGLNHWYKSEQRNHWFGYWFGHDMFTPPFGIYPEMTRNAILFGGTDPGRFCPTYMIFCESFIPHSCQPKEDQKFDRRDVYIITQNALADGTYLDYIRSQYFRSAENDPPFFRDFVSYVLGIPFGTDSSFVSGLSEFAYNTLDIPFNKLGASIEKRRRAEGVYPPVEIYTPSPEDSQNSFREYTDDVYRRQQIGQLKQGETVSIDPAGHVQVSGQVAVMMINGLLCKVIFDHNPTNEFFVEESFPLDWMYPYETPFGIIMKINRDPVTAFTDDIYKKDHEFWCKYSERFIGNWITYDTTVKQIADFVEKVYLHNNYEGFKGDPKFVRDDDGQKAFSKLRSSQAGMYAWRCSPACPPEFRPKTAQDQEALRRETEFAFQQSLAFCPYSPEAVYRYVNFLLQYNRFDDALIVARMCQKLDPYNGSITDLIDSLNKYKASSGDRAVQQQQLEAQVQQMEAELQKNPSNYQNVLMLSRFYGQMQQTDRAKDLVRQALQIPDSAIAASHLRYEDLAALAEMCAESGNYAKLETVIEKIVQLDPTKPEPHYDLAALQAVVGKTADSLQNLQAALDLSAKRLAANSSASNLALLVAKDRRFDSLRTLPEFKKLVGTQ